MLTYAHLSNNARYRILVEFRQSEDESIKYTKELLPGWNYSTSDIDKIVCMIQATKKPQQPKNVLEQIIGDSDLDYLGTDQFHKVADKLCKELLAFKIISIEEEWDRLQVEFLKEHRYHNPFAIKYRKPVKQNI